VLVTACVAHDVGVDLGALVGSECSHLQLVVRRGDARQVGTAAYVGQVMSLYRLVPGCTHDQEGLRQGFVHRLVGVEAVRECLDAFRRPLHMNTWAIWPVRVWRWGL
jgi:hypothetical protein